MSLKSSLVTVFSRCATPLDKRPADLDDDGDGDGSGGGGVSLDKSPDISNVNLSKFRTARFEIMNAIHSSFK